MKKLYIILIGLVALTAVSCERAFMTKDEPSDPVSVFEYLWNRVDQQYVFFDIKGVDWDSVHTVFRPMVYDGMSDDSLFRVCADTPTSSATSTNLPATRSITGGLPRATTMPTLFS